MGYGQNLEQAGSWCDWYSVVLAEGRQKWRAYAGKLKEVSSVSLSSPFVVNVKVQLLVYNRNEC